MRLLRLRPDGPAAALLLLLLLATAAGTAWAQQAQGADAGGAREGWVWVWGGERTVQVGTERADQGLCLSAPPLAEAPCPAAYATNGQCTTAVFSPANDFVSATLEQTGAQVQIGLHTEHECSDREKWLFVLSCDGGGLYAGRGEGWKVSTLDVTAAVGDTIQMKRRGATVTFEHCPKAKPACAVVHTETAAPSTPPLYAHIGIHNQEKAIQLCQIQPVAASAWGWSFLLVLGEYMYLSSIPVPVPEASVQPGVASLRSCS